MVARLKLDWDYYNKLAYYESAVETQSSYDQIAFQSQTSSFVMFNIIAVLPYRFQKWTERFR